MFRKVQLLFQLLISKKQGAFVKNGRRREVQLIVACSQCGAVLKRDAAFARNLIEVRHWLLYVRWQHGFAENYLVSNNVITRSCHTNHSQHARRNTLTASFCCSQLTPTALLVLPGSPFRL